MSVTALRRTAPQPRRADPIFGGRPTEELEFLPAALEVIERPAPPLARIVGLTLSGALAVALGWACIGRVDIVASAEGKLVPAGGAKVIQPLETGTVSGIYAHDGEYVHRGDTLVSLDASQAQADRDRIRAELAAEQLEVARLQTVALGRPLSPAAQADPAAMALAIDEANAQKTELREKLETIDRQMAAHRAEIVEAKAEAERLAALIPPQEKLNNAYRELDAKGLAPLAVMVDSETKLRDAIEQLKVERAKVPELEEEIASLVHQRAAIAAEASKTDLASLADAQVKATSLQKELDAAEQQFRTRTLTAPVDGTVQELTIHTVGGVVEPGQTLMRVAPAGASVEVEANLPNKDVGFVRAGMPVALKVETFPFTKYGVLRGSVLSVSSDATSDKKPDGTESLNYSVRIKLDRDTVEVDGHSVRLEPGMAITAEIMTGRRRVIEYVLSPLAKTLGEAGRER